MVTNQLLHANKHSIIIYSNPTSMTVVSFFPPLFSFCTILRVPSVVAIGYRPPLTK